MNYCQFCVWKKLLDGFDTELQVFYHYALSKELDLFANVASVRKALRDVVCAYKKDTVVSNSSEIFYDSSEKRCAYVLKHCPCFSSAVAKHFLQLLIRNLDILHAVMHQKQINLCCLGGGPGTEAVAIVKVINALNKLHLPFEKNIHLRVQIVDLSEEWKTTAELILQTAQKSPILCDLQKMRVEISFEIVKADLTEPLEERVKNVLLQADIITMVYFVSAINGSKAQDRCTSMLQNVMQLTKPGALLFFLDSAKDIHYNAIMSAAANIQDMKQIYGPFIQEFHTLSMKSIKKYIELYFSHFNAILCLTNCFITSACWTKENFKSVHSTDMLRGSHHSNFRKVNKNRKWKKLVMFKTKKQERFRKRVEELLLSELKMNFIIDDLEDSESSEEPDYLFCDIRTLNAGKAKEKRVFLGTHSKTDYPKI